MFKTPIPVAASVGWRNGAGGGVESSVYVRNIKW
jgi:hypothetical protein